MDPFPFLEEFFDAYFKLDARGRILHLQGKTEELFPDSGQDLTGRVLWEVFPGLAGGELDRHIRAALEKGRTQRAIGQLLPGKGWLEITIRPAADGVECYVRDVSSFRQNQPSSTYDENSRIIFDALLEFIPEGIIIADAAAPKGRYPFLIISRYASGILGLPRETLLTYTLADLLQHVTFFETGTERVITLEEHPLTRFIVRGESTEDEEFDLRNTRGEHMTISVKGGPIRSPDGRVIAGIFSWMDVTERKQRQKRLEQSNRDLEAFAFAASHDLQEPLRKVKGFSELLERRYSGVLDEEGGAYLQRIHAASERMLSLMNDLLEYSRVVVHEVNREAVDLSSVLRDVQDDLTITISSVAGQVQVDALPVVYANRVRMRQLFLNLVGNGLKYHREGQPPRVRVYTAGQVAQEGRPYAQIAVQDNGIGFDPNLLETILQPFTRLHGRSQFEGAGMGLAISRRIVEQLGGAITVESTPGQGSTFYVTLPLQENS